MNIIRYYIFFLQENFMNYRYILFILLLFFSVSAVLAVDLDNVTELSADMDDYLVDNPADIDNVVDNSLSTSHTLYSDDALGSADSDGSHLHLNSELYNTDKNRAKYSGDKIIVEDSIAVGNFSLLYKDLCDFVDNKDYKTVIDGGQTRKVIDSNKYGKVHTFNLTRDYIYDDSTDSEFITGIFLSSTPNHNTFSDIIIDGNGHFIDGNGLASVFKIGGFNVKICNLNFRNLSTIHDYYRADLFGDKYPKKSSMDSAPIIWLGGSGSIVNCTFIDNIGYSGGSILWSGNNGYIGHNKFINNHARCLGGFAYIEGTNVTISDNLVANCEARFDGDALYVKNFSSCIVDHMNFIKVNDTNSSFVAPDIVDGALMDVDSRVCFPSYMTFSYTVVDTFLSKIPRRFWINTSFQLYCCRYFPDSLWVFILW